MSTTPNEVHGTTPDESLSYHAIAARLEVDSERLRQFVDHHPNPTPPIVLGWAKADPAHEDAVARWLDARLQRRRDRAAELDEIIDEAGQPTEARVWKDGEDGGSE